MTRNITHPIVDPTPDIVARIVKAREVREYAVMFADVAGGGLYESLGDAPARRVIAAALKIMTGTVTACGGRIVKTVGDTLVCTYPSADNGARGAIAIQHALQRVRQVPDSEQVVVRIGVNCGPVVEAGNDVFGDTVNVAARLVQIAGPQQILTTANFIERLAPEHRSKARELQLIGVRGRDSYVPVWELLWRPDEDQTQPDLSPSRHGRAAALLTLEFRGLGWELWREGDVLTIGRDDNCNVRLDGNLASRDHARILVRNGKFILIDHSTNGTYLVPEGGTTTAMIHEEYVLSGVGNISFGCTAGNAGNEQARYSIGTRSLLRAVQGAESAAADRTTIAPKFNAPEAG